MSFDVALAEQVLRARLARRSPSRSPVPQDLQPPRFRDRLRSDPGRGGAHDPQTRCQHLDRIDPGTPLHPHPPLPGGGANRSGAGDHGLGHRPGRGDGPLPGALAKHRSGRFEPGIRLDVVPAVRRVPAELRRHRGLQRSVAGPGQLLRRLLRRGPRRPSSRTGEATPRRRSGGGSRGDGGGRHPPLPARRPLGRERGRELDRPGNRRPGRRSLRLDPPLPRSRRVLYPRTAPDLRGRGRSESGKSPISARDSAPPW